MKLLCLIMSFAILLAGCYTNTPLTKDSPPSTAEVSFRLNDGTFIVSRTYHRVENGYHVVGTSVSRQYWNSDKAFDGILSDGQIKEVVSSELDVESTVIVLGLPVLFLVGSVAFRASVEYTADNIGREKGWR
jgi:hypothetical protein